MATLYITEYDRSATDRIGQEIPLALEPALAEQQVSFTTATASSAFNSATRFVRIYSTAACHIAFGTSPTATTAYAKFAADTEYWRAVAVGSGLKLSVYDGTS